MKCTNCGAAVPGGSSVCPECGVFAGDHPPTPARGGPRAASGWVVAIIVLAAAGAGGWWWYSRQRAAPHFDTVPAHVMVKGSAEGRAVVALRYHLVTELKLVKSECLAVISQGYSNHYYSFDAVDSCQRTRLGRWRVDAITFRSGRT
ncbi:MAG TPA: zinc ribbon domain-containing protein [Thermoanaerobaculia bacterium]|nr:zinc ribbon domain-containing protein [Thermoanaerobaculia bacterium]